MMTWQRKDLTPEIAVAGILDELAKTFVRASSLTEQDFVNRVAIPIFQDADIAKRDPDEVAREMLQGGPVTDTATWLALDCLYCSAAMDADRSGAQQLAWSYVTTVSGLSAYLRAVFDLKDAHKAEFARRGAWAMHAEDRAMKSEAIAAYLRGNFASKDEAAAHISSKVVPMKFRTVRDWLKGVIKD